MFPEAGRSVLMTIPPLPFYVPCGFTIRGSTPVCNLAPFTVNIIHTSVSHESLDGGRLDSIRHRRKRFELQRRRLLLFTNWRGFLWTGDNFDVAACCAIRWIGLPAWIPHQFRSLALKNGLEIKMPPSATNHVGVGCRVAAVNNIGQMSRPLLRHCHHPSS